MGQRIFKRLRELLDVDFSTFQDGDRVVYHAATDEFVGMASAGGSSSADDTTFTPAGNIAATDVQAALEELDSEKAATSHVHSGADITSGTVADARIASTIARDSEVTSAVAAEATARDAAIASSESGQVRDGDAAGGVLAGTYPSPSFAADMATQAELDSAVATLQPIDSDLTAIAGLTPTNDDIIQRKAGVWANRSLAQLLTDLNLGASYQPLDSDLTAIAALSTTSFGRGLLALADAAALRVSAGLVIGTDVEAHDTDLTTFAGLSPTNDDVLQRKAGAWSNRTLAQLLVDLAALGTTFQPLDSDLTALAGLSIAADKLPYGNGSHTMALADFTAAARALLDDADASTMLSTLGVSTFIKTLLDDADAATARATLGISSGGLTQILDSTLGSAAAGFDTNTILGGNIPSTYTALLGQVQAKCDAGSVQQVRIRFNNDSGSNYDRQQIAGSSSSASAEQATAQTSARLCTVPGTDGSTGSSGSAFFQIPNYTGTVFHKHGLSKCLVLYTGTPTYEQEEIGLRWRSTAAITRIALLMGDGSNMITGSRFTLWGAP